MKLSMNRILALLCIGACGIGVSLALADDPVCFEAEDAHQVVAPFRDMIGTNATEKGTPLDARGASGERYLEITQGAGSPPKVTAGEASFTFDVPAAGKHILWCRTWWLDECGNSMTMSVDGGRAFTLGQDATYKAWHWVKAPTRIKELNMKAGTHTLTIKNREDGVRIDQILLTRDRRYVPVGAEASRPLAKPEDDRPEP